jgi:hypothetical protein
VERFHQTLQRELLDDVPVWPDLEAVQAAVDAFLLEYNTNRPHQSLDMSFPSDRFTTRPVDGQLPLRVPSSLTMTEPACDPTPPARPPQPAPLMMSANGVDPVNLAADHPDGSRLRQPRHVRATLLAGPHPRRRHPHPVGGHHRHPPTRGRCPTQDRAVPADRSPPASAARRRRPACRAATGAAAEPVVPFDPDHSMFNLDLNDDGHVLGLEIIGARKHLPPALLRAILDHEDQTKNNQ